MTNILINILEYLHDIGLNRLRGRHKATRIRLFLLDFEFDFLRKGTLSIWHYHLTDLTVGLPRDVIRLFNLRLISRQIAPQRQIPLVMRILLPLLLLVYCHTSRSKHHIMFIIGFICINRVLRATGVIYRWIDTVWSIVRSQWAFSVREETIIARVMQDTLLSVVAGTLSEKW